MKKIVNWLKWIWKDPVWSKVISVGIIAGLAWLTDSFPVLIKILTHQIDLWLTLVFIILTFLFQNTIPVTDK